MLLEIPKLEKLYFFLYLRENASFLFTFETKFNFNKRITTLQLWSTPLDLTLNYRVTALKMSLLGLKLYYMEEIAKEVHRPTYKPKTYRKVLSYYPNDIWSGDLVEMNSEGMQEQNKGYKYILVVIDLYSRFAWTRKLKSKTGKETSEALKTIIDEVDKNLKEFYNKNVIKM